MTAHKPADVEAVHQPIDALHTPSGRIVQVCSARDCETDDGDFIQWPCPALRRARAAELDPQEGPDE